MAAAEERRVLHGSEPMSFVCWHQPTPLKQVKTYIQSPTGVQAQRYVHVVSKELLLQIFLIILSFFFVFPKRGFVVVYFSNLSFDDSLCFCCDHDLVKKEMCIQACMSVGV